MFCSGTSKNSESPESIDSILLGMEIVTESNDLSNKSNKEGNENLDNGLSYDAPILDFTQNISESVSSLNGNDFDILETDVVLEKMTENILHENQVELKNPDNENTTEDGNIFEQDIHDVLFEAGYSIEEIQAAKTRSCSSESVTESDIDHNEITVDNSGINQAHSLLKEVRIKNVNRLIIGTLNINSLASKFEQLKLVMKNSLDVLILQETKFDSIFPPTWAIHLGRIFSAV